MIKASGQGSLAMGTTAPTTRGFNISMKKNRRLWRLKKFYVETWDEDSVVEKNVVCRCRCIEIHHRESGSISTMIARSRRELFKEARLVAAKMENPDLQKTIDRLEGKEELSWVKVQEELLNQQQQSLQAQLSRQMLYGPAIMQPSFNHVLGIANATNQGPSQKPKKRPPLSISELKALYAQYKKEQEDADANKR